MSHGFERDDLASTVAIHLILLRQIEANVYELIPGCSVGVYDMEDWQRLHPEWRVIALG